MRVAGNLIFFILPLFVLISFSSFEKNDKNFAVHPVRLDEKHFIKVEGLVSIDSKPSNAYIEITSAQKHKAFVFNTKTDANGVFRTQLPNGDEYEITVRVSNFPPQVIVINTTLARSDSTLNVYADFTSPEYDKKLAELRRSVEGNAKKVKAKFNEAQFATIYGNTQKDGLAYKVQVGAYKFFENFNYNAVIGLPKIIRKTDNDFITRFTMGNFKTYKEATELLLQIKKGQLNDAFVVAFYKEERKLLPQLLDEKIIP